MTTRVLICDDSSVARKQMARSLPDDWDIDLTFAEHGEAALEAIRDGDGDIMFLDLNMPVMDGYETLENIVADDLPCLTIVVSGDIQPEAHERVKALGAIAFIKKPSDKETIAKILKDFGLYQSLAIPAKAPEQKVAAENPAPSPNKVGSLAAERSQAAGDSDYRDCIQEISNVAMGQAADRLARLLHVFIKMPIPNVNLLEVSELQMALSNSQHGSTYSAVCQGFIGSGLSGEALIMFNDGSYQDMAKLLNYQGELDQTVELELIMEASSILSGAMINGIASQLDLQFSQGHPRVLGQHVKVGDLLKANATRWKKTLAIEISYEIENYNISCDLLLLFTEDSLDKLYKQLSYLIN